MRTTIRGKGLNVSERDRAYVERKMQRLERMLDDRTQAEVELRREANRRLEDSHIVEVHLSIDGQPVRGVAAAASFRAAADEVIDKLERRTVDHRARPRGRRRADGLRLPDGRESLLGSDGPGSDGPGSDGPGSDEDGRIVKVKRFAIEPMFEEDAISRMEELGHTFFIFVNAENERVAVLYRRRDDRYGLIEPVIGSGHAPRA